MGVFSESPKSFKMDRNSPLASQLKSSISHKLLQFLGNYSDDVLAEYITVLVCNGKHQNQARYDLEAFLGERSAEFVTWLWDLLIGLSDLKDVTVTGTHDSNADKDWRTNRLRELQNHGAGNVDRLPTKDEKLYHVSCNPILSNDMEIPEGVQHCPDFDAPLNGVNSKMASSQTCGREITREIGASGNIHDDSLAYEPSRIGGSSKISTGGDQSIQCLDTFKKSRLSILGAMGCLSENPHPRQSYAANVSGRSLSPKAVGAVSHQNDKSRGSAWDRLSKPSENPFVRGNTVDANGVDIIEQGEKVLDQRTSSST